MVPGRCSTEKQGVGLTSSNGQVRAKPPIRWTGILFALAANVLLVTLAESAVSRLGGSRNLLLLATVVAPLLAGILTAIYTGARGAVHSFAGGLLSVPVLGLYVFPNSWPLAVFAAAFCTLGGALTELATRRSLVRR
jgi:hypothetical protein